MHSQPPRGPSGVLATERLLAFVACYRHGAGSCHLHHLGMSLSVPSLLGKWCLPGGNQTETEVWPPAATKAKLERQVLVQKESGLFRCCVTRGSGGLPPISSPCPSRCSSRGRAGQGRLFKHPVISLAFGTLRPEPVRSLAFGAQCNSLHLHGLGQRKRLPGTPTVYSNKVLPL